MKPTPLCGRRRPTVAHPGLRGTLRLAALGLLLAGCAPIAALEPPGRVTAVAPAGAPAEPDPHFLGDVAGGSVDSLVVLIAGDNRPGYRMQTHGFGYPQLAAFSFGAPGTWLPALAALSVSLVRAVVPTLDGLQDLATGLVTHRPNGGREAQVNEALLARPADLVIHSGDLVFDGRRAQLWRDFERKFGTPEGPPGALRARAPFLAAPGNHEKLHTPEGRANWIAVIGAPPRPERYWFAVDAGGGLARFVFVDTNVMANAHGVYDEATAEALSEEQFDWLERVLDTDARYRFVVVHHPLVVVGNHGDDWLPEAAARRRDRLLEICARRGVAAMFAGHEHLYHRVYARSAGAAGLWLVTSGGSGSPLHRLDREVMEREYARPLPAGLALDPASSRIELRHHFLRMVVPAGDRPPVVEVLSVNGRGDADVLERLTLTAPR